MSTKYMFARVKIYLWSNYLSSSFHVHFTMPCNCHAFIPIVMGFELYLRLSCLFRGSGAVCFDCRLVQFVTKMRRGMHAQYFFLSRSISNYQHRAETISSHTWCSLQLQFQFRFPDLAHESSIKVKPFQMCPKLILIFTFHRKLTLQ